jgi:hypothetical protein
VCGVYLLGCRYTLRELDPGQWGVCRLCPLDLGPVQFDLN